MQDDYVLMLFPRSGLGFKYRLQLNTQWALSIVITITQIMKGISSAN